MVQRRLFSCLALLGSMLSPAAWGQEMARVVSTTPVIQTVSVTEPSCTSVGAAPALCGQVTQLQNRITHYNVVYEYGGKSYGVALAQDPGPWLPIQVTPVVEIPPPMAPTTVWVSVPAPLPPTLRKVLAHVPFDTVTVPTLLALLPRVPIELVTLPPVTLSMPVPLLPTHSVPVPERICSSPAEAEVIMSSTTVFAAPDVPVRLSVPVFVSESVPVPEITLLIVRVVPD